MWEKFLIHRNSNHLTNFDIPSEKDLSKYIHSIKETIQRTRRRLHSWSQTDDGRKRSSKYVSVKMCIYI